VFQPPCVRRATQGGGPAVAVPGTKPSDRYEVLFRLCRADSGAAWRFDRLVPVVLGGDGAAPLALD